MSVSTVIGVFVGIGVSVGAGGKGVSVSAGGTGVSVSKRGDAVGVGAGVSVSGASVGVSCGDDIVSVGYIDVGILVIKIGVLVDTNGTYSFWPEKMTVVVRQLAFCNSDSVI
jgi:hypothetical protein